MNTALGRKAGFTIEVMKFRTGRRDKEGKPIFEEHIVKNFCGKKTMNRTEVYHVKA